MKKKILVCILGLSIMMLSGCTGNSNKKHAGYSDNPQPKKEFNENQGKLFGN